MTVPPHRPWPSISFLPLLAAVVALRLALMLASQHSICGDEATVGVMAIHVIEKAERPVFAWHEHYNGGAALTAYLASLPFRLFGASELALKLVPCTFSVLAFGVVYFFVRSARGPRAACYAALLYATSVDLLKWNFDARGGYAECQLLIPLALWLLLDGCLGEASHPSAALVLGGLCGFGVYLLGLFIPVAVTAAVLLGLRAWLRRSGTQFLLWLLGAAVGIVPLVAFRAQSGPVGLDPAPILGRLLSAPGVFLRTLVQYVPAVMTYANIEGVPRVRLLPNAVEYAAIVLGVTGLITVRRRELAALWRGWRVRHAAPVTIEALLLFYVLVYVVLYSLHPLAGEDARHLLFLEPPLAILAGLGFAEARGLERSRHLRAAAAIVLAVVVADRATQHVALMRDDGVYGPLGRSEPGDADAVAAFLSAHGVRHVITEDWDLSWRMVFRTHEAIEASHSVLWLGRLLREQQNRGVRYAVISGPGMPHAKHIARLLAHNGLGERYVVAGRRVYLVTGGALAP